MIPAAREVAGDPGPMALAAAGALVGGEVGQLSLPEANALRLERRLARYFRERTLIVAVLDLLGFARHLRENNQPAIADRLVRVALTAEAALRIQGVKAKNLHDGFES